MIEPSLILVGPEYKRLRDLKLGNRKERPQFLDADLAREALGRLVRRISQAIDEGLLRDPRDVGYAGGAMITLASHLCQDFDAADFYADSWRDCEIPELDAFLQTTSQPAAAVK